MYGITNSRQFVYCTAIFFSLMISIFVSARIDVINSDGVCYLLSAEMMQFGLKQATKVCDQAGWPLYAWLIAKVAVILHLKYINAALVLNAIFSAGSVLCFLLIVNVLSKSKHPVKLLWLAAAVILLAKGFNDNRAHIVKDHGYWACSLLAILFCLYFIENNKWRYALGWAGASILASLFRVEGVIFLACVPFLIWFDRSRSFKERACAFLQMYTVNIMGAIGILITLYFFPQENLGRLHEISWERIGHVAHTFQSRAHLLEKYILDNYGQGYKSIVLGLTLISWYLVYVISCLTLVYTLLIAYAWRKKCLQHLNRERLILWAYVVINIGITFIFLTENMFLSKRYLIALCLILMLWVPFALAHLLNHRAKWLYYTAIVFMILFGIKSIGSFGYSKDYVRQAGEWIQQNVSQKSTLYSNDILLMYYSQHFGNEIYVQQKIFKSNPQAFQQAEYIALRVNKKNKDPLVLNMSPIISFSNERGDQVNIYRR